MLTIRVFGTEPPCVKCKQAEDIARKVAERYPGQVEVEKLPVLGEEAVRLGIMMSPAVAVNDRVVTMGRLPSETDLERSVKQEIA